MRSMLVIATIVSIAVVPRVAGAQASSWNATVNGQTAVTDNVFAAPTDGNREPEIFFQLRPGILFRALRASCTMSAPTPRRCTMP